MHIHLFGLLLLSISSLVAMQPEDQRRNERDARIREQIIRLKLKAARGDQDAIDDLIVSADGGDGAACKIVGDLYKEGILRTNRFNSSGFTRTIFSEQGESSATTQEYGTVTNDDYQKMVDYYWKAVHRNNGDAMYEMSRLLSKGIPGVLPADPKRAQEYLEKAVDIGRCVEAFYALPVPAKPSEPGIHRPGNPPHHQNQRYHELMKQHNKAVSEWQEYNRKLELYNQYQARKRLIEGQNNQ